MTHPLLVSFEQRADLLPAQAAQVLGVAYSAYMGYRAGRRELPRYIKRHVSNLLAIPPDTLESLVELYRV